MIEIQAPVLKDEGEEAAWYFNNQDVLARQYVESHSPTGLRQELYLMIEAEDMAKSQAQAESSGMLFGDYLREVLHDALERREAA